MCPERVSVGEEGEVIPFTGAEVKGAGTNSGKSGTRNLKAESIRSRAESTGGCVKLKTVTETRRSSARDTVTKPAKPCLLYTSDAADES